MNNFTTRSCKNPAEKIIKSLRHQVLGHVHLFVSQRFVRLADRLRNTFPTLFFAALALIISFSAAAGPTPASASNVIQLENAKTVEQGVTQQWQLTHYAAQREIEGYASATSINRGESINFHVSTVDPTYTLTVYRAGWYGGNGGRQLHGPIQLNGVKQPTCPVVDEATSLIECNWSVSYSLNVPATPADAAAAGYWASGVYLVKLTGSSGKQSYIAFDVRDDGRPSAILFQNAVTSYQAYNGWGGKSLYPYNSSSGKRAYKVSFNRPYDKGAGGFMHYELKALRFLEREGYDVSYATDIDNHVSGAQLLTPARHKLFMIAGHDEYWTRQMRDNVETARNQGVNLAFFGANSAYWQIRLDPSSAGQINGSQPNRTIVAYKDKALDPYATTDPAQLTVKFRDPQINRPEASLIGGMYDYDPVDTDIVIADCLTWVCAGTQLKPGGVLRGLLGHEADGLNAASPPGTAIIAASPYAADNQTRFAHMTYYEHGSGAQVFNSGTMFWAYGLDDCGVRPTLVNADAQQMTRNILNRLAGTPAKATADVSRSGDNPPGNNQAGHCVFGGEPGTVDWRRKLRSYLKALWLPAAILFFGAALFGLWRWRKK